MFSPPTAAQPLAKEFSQVFTRPTAQRMVWLSLAALLTFGRRTFTRILITVNGLVEGHFSTFYRMFSRPAWSNWSAGRILARLLVDLTPPGEPVVLLGDSTVTEHPGRKVYGKGKHRDAVRSSHSYTAWRWGHKWVALMVAVRLPFISRPWALPALVALYRTAETNQTEGRRHKTPAQLARQLTRVLIGWFPDRRFVLVADGDFSSHETAQLAHRHRRRLTFVGKFYADAALYALPPAYAGKGRPRVKGDKQPSPQEEVAGATLKKTQVAWYGGARRAVSLTGGVGHWYRPGGGLVKLRWVYVEDRQGTHRPEYFFSTDPAMPLKQIVEYYTLRWSIEVTFQEARLHLGLETTRHWSAAAVERVEPWLLALYSLTTLIWIEHVKHHPPCIRQWPWYEKSEPTFADVLADVRRLIWTESIFPHPLFQPVVQKLEPKARDILLNTLIQAA